MARDIFPQLVYVDTGKVQLADLLLERHPGEKIVDAAFDWLIGLKIRGDCGARLRTEEQTSEQQNNGRENEYLDGL